MINDALGSYMKYVNLMDNVLCTHVAYNIVLLMLFAYTH